MYLIPTDQCPETFPPGPTELYAASGPASVNNVLSMNLTTPGIFYFACQVSFCLSQHVPSLTGVAQIHAAKSVLLKVGDHCVEDGQKLVVSVTDSTPGALTGLGMVTTSTG